MAEFDDRLTAIEDRIAITEVIASYGYDYDEFRIDQWLEKFTPDATVTVSLEGNELGGTTGRDAIGNLLGARVAGFQADNVQRRHNMTSIVVDELTATTAKARSYLLLTSTGPDGPTELVTSGRYLFDLVKQDGVWLVSAWVIGLDDPGFAEGHG
ncbi:MAG: nuclear transport factor 2 family protein [Acidimicrobiia bacterium]